MRREDFLHSTPKEFMAVADQWRQMRDADTRDSWDRVRVLAAITLQPHLRKGRTVAPAELLPMPWDKPSAPKLTAAERKAAADTALRALGETY